MPKIKITHKGIEALVRAGADKQTDYTDSLIAGRVFRLGPRGGFWYYMRRVDGQLYRIKLGEWPAMSISDAGKEVEDIEQAIRAGQHPKAHQARKATAKRESRKIDQARLFENVTAAWCDHHLPDVAKQTRSMYLRAVRRLNGEFADRDISTITRGELVRFLDALKSKSKSGIPANHAAATMRLLFAYAADRLELTANPADGIKNPAKVKKRDRILTRDEIRVLWEACERAGYPHGHGLRFAICTGQRIGEVGDIRRNDLDGQFWKLSRNKTGKRIDVFLAPLAVAILDDCPDFGPAAPFFSASGGRIGLRPDGWHLAIKRHITPRLDEAAEALELEPITDHWTPHDLRRTVRSGLTGWAGVFPDIAERTINHAISGIRSHYDFADYRPHVADALQKWDQELARILAGKAAPVVPFRRQAV